MPEKFPGTNFLEKKEKAFFKGQKINFENADGSSKECEVINVLDSNQAASALNLGYQIKNPVPIVILNGNNPRHAASYHKEFGVIFAYDDTVPEAIHHEIIHSLEMAKPLPDELAAFYKKVLELLPDISNLNPNYRKDIHEFIADAYSKEGFIETLKNKGLYEEFKDLTAYIFE